MQLIVIFPVNWFSLSHLFCIFAAQKPERGGLLSLELFLEIYATELQLSQNLEFKILERAKILNSRFWNQTKSSIQDFGIRRNPEFKILE